MINLTAKQCLLMNHPSQEYVIPREAIPGSGVNGVVTAFGYLCHYHHYTQNTNGSVRYLTRIEIIDLNKECRAADIEYEWAVVPMWATKPTSNAFALTISESAISFFVCEHNLVVLPIPLRCSGVSFQTVDVVSLLRIHGIDCSRWVAIASYETRVCVMGASADRRYAVLVNTGTHLQSFYDLSGLDLDVESIHSFRFVALNGHNVLAVNYFNSSTKLNLRIICLCGKSQEILYTSIPYKSIYCTGIVLLSDTKVKLEYRQIKAASILDSLFELAVSFSMPFVSLIESETSHFAAFSTRLSSPWALPVALVYMMLFFLFCPFLLVPKMTRFMILSVTSGFHETMSSKLVMRSFSDFPEIGCFKVVEQNQSHVRIRKYAPEESTKLVYLKARNFRLLSIGCYLLCMAGFAVSMVFVLTVPLTAKFDLFAQLGLADALSVYALAISQDVAALGPLSYYSGRYWFHTRVLGLS